jgi:hypothetical protein
MLTFVLAKCVPQIDNYETVSASSSLGADVVAIK